MLSDKICYSEKWKEHSTSSIAAKMSSFVYCLYLEKKQLYFEIKIANANLFHSTFPLAPMVLTMPGAGGVSSLR